jgi:G protein pathway suppressor 2
MLILSTEQEQDAAMERHRREQEQKRKRDALSLGEVREQLVHLEKKLKSLRDEKNELFLQLKKVLNDDEKRKKQRDAEILAAHQQAIQNAQQQQQPSSLPPQPTFQGYPYIDSRSLMTAVRPTPSHAQPDTYPRLPVSTTSASQSSNILSISGNGPGIGQATNKNTQVVKRRHEGSPSPTPPQRLQTSAPGNIKNNNIPHLASQSIPSEFFYITNVINSYTRLLIVSVIP